MRSVRCLSAQKHALHHGARSREGPTASLSARHGTLPVETCGCAVKR